MLTLDLFLFLVSLRKAVGYAAQAGLELCPTALECCDYRCVPLHLFILNRYVLVSKGR
jgi:hypothetical protein